MADENTTLEMWGQELPSSLQNHVQQMARKWDENLPEEQREHVAALNAFASYVSTCGKQDQRFWALSQTSACLGGSLDNYAAGPMQRELLERLGGGFGVRPPAPSTTLDELVGAAVADVIAFLRESVTASQAELAEARADAARFEVDMAAVAEAQQEAAAMRGRLAEAQETSERLTETVELLKGHLGPNAPAANSKKKRRRTRVPDHPGVYFEDRDEGRVYEIGWQEDGKTRWRKIGLELDEAIKAREEVTTKQKEMAAV